MDPTARYRLILDMTVINSHLVLVETAGDRESGRQTAVGHDWLSPPRVPEGLSEAPTQAAEARPGSTAMEGLGLWPTKVNQSAI